MDPANISVVLNWAVPDCKKQLQRFLGFANFYHHFVQNYNSVAAPLTSAKSPFQWSPAASTAFQELKKLYLGPYPPDPRSDSAVRGVGRRIRRGGGGSPGPEGCPLNSSSTPAPSSPSDSPQLRGITTSGTASCWW